MNRKEIIEDQLRDPAVWELAREIYNVGSRGPLGTDTPVNHLTWMVAASLALSHAKDNVPNANPDGTQDEWMLSFSDLVLKGTTLPEL